MRNRLVLSILLAVAMLGTVTVVTILAQGGSGPSKIPPTKALQPAQIANLPAPVGAPVALTSLPKGAPLDTDLLREPSWQLPQEARPITLAEAWEIVDAHAKKWQPGAAIALLQSVDHLEDSPSSGQDGRRRAWQATLFGTDPPGTQLRVHLVDGFVVEEVKQPPALDYVPVASRPALDSPKALGQALAAKPGFTSTDDKGKGFHFALGSSLGGSPVLTVRGTLRHMPAIISLDATTGTVMSARLLTFASGGILYSSDAGMTWHASNLQGKMVTAIAADPLTKDQAYGAVSQDGEIMIYHTRDGGKTWAPMGSLPDTAGNWPFSLVVVAEPSRTILLVVGTASGLWVSGDGKAWARVSGLPDGPKQWLRAVQSDTGYRLLVSITAGEEQGLYASSDLSSWTKVANGTYRLSLSFDRRMVLATDEQKPGQAMVVSTSDEAVLKVPGPVLRAAGAFDGSAPIILDSPLYGIGRLFRQAESWPLQTNVASLAAAPDFPTSQVAIVGGFRTGVYRTRDAGQTWQQVLPDPAGLLKGTGEIVAVEFLPPTTVIAVNGGELTWQSY